MGISSSTEIIFYDYEGNFTTEAIKHLRKGGWKICSYLAVGQEPGDRMKDFLNLQILFEDLNEKEINKETICLFLTFDNTLVGGFFYIYKKSFSIDINWQSYRQTMEEAPRFNTDFSWYTPKLLLPFEGTDLQVKSIKHEDSD